MLWNREIVSAKDVFLVIANIWLLRRLDKVTSFHSNHPLKVVSGPKGLEFGFLFLFLSLVFQADIFTKFENWAASLKAMCFPVHVCLNNKSWSEGDLSLSSLRCCSAAHLLSLWISPCKEACCIRCAETLSSYFITVEDRCPSVVSHPRLPWHSGETG